MPKNVKEYFDVLRQCNFAHGKICRPRHVNYDSGIVFVVLLEIFEKIAVENGRCKNFEKIANYRKFVDAKKSY